jgi:hypothetical protein
MNYSDDTCMTEFTPGQTVAMIASYVELRSVPGSVQEIQENDGSDTPANSTSDSLYQQSDTTDSNNVDIGSEPPESQVGDGSTSENTDNSSFAAFSSIFGFSPSASSGNGSGFGSGFPQNNAGTSSSQSSIFGSYGGFGTGSYGSGGGGQADIFALSSGAAPSPTTTNSKTCTSLKSAGDLCSGGSQCCSGVCGGIFFFDKKCV